MTFEDFGGWSETLAQLTSGQSLSGSHCQAVLGEILAGEASDAQIAALLVSLRQKGETVEELVGLQHAMMAAAEPLSLGDDVIDIVGVGGAASRRKHALNVSTMACFVAAGAGARVCKHGNRKASSTSGSFDLLEALGVAIDPGPAQLEALVATHGLAFAFARRFHPAMRHVGPVRAQLGIPTVFNVLGPLAHPGGVSRQVVGVADGSLAPKMIETLAGTGSVRSLVVTGDGALDEFSTTGPSKVLSLNEGEITELTVDAADYGIAQSEPEALAGGDAQVNADIARRLFAGEPGPVRDVVVLNAAAGLIVAGLADDFGDGITQAGAAIDDGRVAAKLAALVQDESSADAEADR